MTFRLTRRHMLQGSTALAVAAAAKPGTLWAEGKVLKYRGHRAIQTLDPAFMNNGTEDAVLQLTNPRLTNWKEEDWGWILMDALSVEQVDPTHVTFSLRPGMTWTNGFGEVTAEDVKFSYERIANPENDSGYKSDWELLDNIELTDKLSGVMTFKEPFAPLFVSTLPNNAGAILSKRAMGGDPKRNWGMEHPAEAGPYLLDDYKRGQKLVVKRNPDWTGPKPYFDELQIFEITDEKTAEIGYEAGEVDATGISVTSMPTFKSDPVPNTVLVSKPALTYWWVGMMVEHPHFKDIRVRRAVQHAIDVDEVIEGALGGLVERATGIICPGVIGYREKGLLQAEPDLDKSRDLLKQAGYPNGFDTHIQTRNVTEYSSAAQIVSSQLAEVGINAEVRPEESGSLWARSQDKGDAWNVNEMILWSYGAAPDPSWHTAWFTPDQIGLWNWERWNSPEFGELHLKALSEPDLVERGAIYERMSDLMVMSGAYAFLLYGVNAWLYNDDLHLALRPDALFPFPRRCRAV